MNRFALSTLAICLVFIAACGEDELANQAMIKTDTSFRDTESMTRTCSSDSDCRGGGQCLLGQCSMAPVNPVNPESNKTPTPEEEMMPAEPEPESSEEPATPTPLLPDPTTNANRSDDADTDADTADEDECARDFDCPMNQTCSDGECIDRSSVPEHGCQADNECGPNRRCIDHACVNEDAFDHRLQCQVETDCPAGELCQEGQCVAAAAAAQDGIACEQPAAISVGDSIVGRTPDQASAHTGSCGRATGPESVYLLQPVADGTVCITTDESNFDTIVYVRRGHCEMGEESACNDDDREFNIANGVFDSTVQLDVTGGESYYVFVDGSREQAGDYTLRLTDGPCVSPSPDSPVGEPNMDENEVGGVCDNPPELAAGIVKQGDTRQGASEHRAACGSGFGKEQVYHYRSFIDRTVCVRTVGAEFFTTVYVQADNCGGADRVLETVACGEHPAIGRDTSLEFEVTGLTHYFIYVDAINEGGTYGIELLEGPCPQED